MDRGRLLKLVEKSIKHAAQYADGFDPKQIQTTLNRSGVTSALLIMLRYSDDDPVWREFFRVMALKLERIGPAARLELSNNPAWEAVSPAFVPLKEIIRKEGVSKQRVGVQYLASVFPLTPSWLLAALIEESRDRVTVQIAAQRLLEHVTNGEAPSVVLTDLSKKLPKVQQRYSTVPVLVSTLNALTQVLA